MEPEVSNPFATETNSAARELTISDAAVKRLAFLRKQEGDDNLMLRISVSGGGCSGFQYGFAFDDSSTPDDLVFERDGIRVITDEVSMDLLAGSEIDFVDNLMGQYFQVVNPNAASSCGCGTSFSVS